MAIGLRIRRDAVTAQAANLLSASRFVLGAVWLVAFVHGDRRPADVVLHYVMIGQQANRVSDCIAIVLDRQNHVGIVGERCLIDFGVSGIEERVEHPFEVVLPREPR